MGYSGWAEWRRFSAAMLALMGAFNVAEGLVALYDRRAVHVDPDRLLLLGLAGWARVTLMLGALLLALGMWLSVVTIRVRPAALSVVCVHALSQLGVLAALPAWALLMISFDVVIIFALTATPAGAAASMARGSTGAGAGRATPAGRAVTCRHPPAMVGPGRAGPVGAGIRIRYRPRHEVPAADTTLVLGPPLTDDDPRPADPVATGAAAVVTGTAVVPDARAAVSRGDTAPRALPSSPQQAAPDSPPVAPTTATKRPAPPIIGAISGRWPDARQR
ncbi:hypothetical protein HC031_20915 [Planosporangium thailandense]|uniref:DUF7144 domain-containing protein n=1 Tax=Planosporangium thailandense TaxID=765197 RepID=A0ABX0Y455_9ACTN|nr:hypothetical protein [Planosporangium thailandense]NJC72159.1 hypothetical protein [Planosporangium thailandense]